MKDIKISEIHIKFSVYTKHPEFTLMKSHTDNYRVFPASENAVVELEKKGTRDAEILLVKLKNKILCVTYVESADAGLPEYVDRWGSEKPELNFNIVKNEVVLKSITKYQFKYLTTHVEECGGKILEALRAYNSDLILVVIEFNNDISLNKFRSTYLNRYAECDQL